MTLREFLQYVNEETENSGYVNCSADARSCGELRRSNSNSKILSRQKANKQKQKEEEKEIVEEEREQTNPLKPSL